jgi:hypothetical protein
VTAGRGKDLQRAASAVLGKYICGGYGEGRAGGDGLQCLGTATAVGPSVPAMTPLGGRDQAKLQPKYARMPGATAGTPEFLNSKAGEILSTSPNTPQALFKNTSYMR